MVSCTLCQLTALVLHVYSVPSAHMLCSVPAGSVFTAVLTNSALFCMRRSTLTWTAGSCRTCCMETSATSSACSSRSTRMSHFPSKMMTNRGLADSSLSGTDVGCLLPGWGLILYCVICCAACHLQPHTCAGAWCLIVHSGVGLQPHLSCGQSNCSAATTALW